MIQSAFYDGVRASLYDGTITSQQMSGLKAVLSAWEGSPIRHASYGLATALAEVGKNMQPVREGFKKTDEQARMHVNRQGYAYAKPAGPFDHVYYGRGYVQLTWLANYERAEKELGIPFVRNPDLALVPANAALIMRKGMEHGWFTKKKLSDYLDGKKPDYRNARRIINGADRASEIAGYAVKFENALCAAKWGDQPVSKVPSDTPVIAKNTPMTVKSRTAQGASVAAIGGAATVSDKVTEIADKLQQADGHISAGTWVGLVIGGLIIGGALYALYARWHDGGGQWTWQKDSAT